MSNIELAILALSVALAATLAVAYLAYRKAEQAKRIAEMSIDKATRVVSAVDSAMTKATVNRKVRHSKSVN